MLSTNGITVVIGVACLCCIVVSLAGLVYLVHYLFVWSGEMDSEDE
jgi:hypothetical protein